MQVLNNRLIYPVNNTKHEETKQNTASFEKKRTGRCHENLTSEPVLFRRCRGLAFAAGSAAVGAAASVTKVNPLDDY